MIISNKELIESLGSSNTICFPAQVSELLPMLNNLRLLSFEPRDEEPCRLTFIGSTADHAQADYETFYYQEHGQFPVERDDYDNNQK